MDLKTGTLSNELLKACGDELQKKCSEYAPLKSEEVAVTEAENLKANSIYHIALPDYSDSQATRVNYIACTKRISYNYSHNNYYRSSEEQSKNVFVPLKKMEPNLLPFPLSVWVTSTTLLILQPRFSSRKLLNFRHEIPEPTLSITL